MRIKRKSTIQVRLEELTGEALSLGMLMRAIRDGEEWSLADMGAKLRVTRAHVAAIENGKPVSAEAAARYARALRYSPEQFVRLALQDEVQRAGLHYRIDVSAA